MCVFVVIRLHLIVFSKLLFPPSVQIEAETRTVSCPPTVRQVRDSWRSTVSSTCSPVKAAARLPARPAYIQSLSADQNSLSLTLLLQLQILSYMESSIFFSPTKKPVGVSLEVSM